MDAAFSPDAAVFNDYLARIGKPYLLLDDSGRERAHLRFSGRFLDQEVVWDCEFVTLASELRRCKASSMRCFIDVGTESEHGLPVRVGLNIERVDDPEILKMIVMIRNYRLLRRGRREFGDRYPADSAG